MAITAGSERLSRRTKLLYGVGDTGFSLTEVGAAMLSTGGAVSNTRSVLLKLDVNERLIARVADDLISSLSPNNLANRGDRLAQDLTVGRAEPTCYTALRSIAPAFLSSFSYLPVRLQFIEDSHVWDGWRFSTNGLGVKLRSRIVV